MSYKPRPIDTTQVKLNSRILALTERLAENAHDVWARARMDEGWSFGPRRDDDRMTNPCLVPYDELPDSEKEHNRQAALETIKAICAWVTGWMWPRFLAGRRPGPFTAGPRWPSC